MVLYSLGEIEIGANAVVSQLSYLCTGAHDYSRSDSLIYAKRITVEPEVWVAAGVFVAPGVIIGHGAVIGERSKVLERFSLRHSAATHVHAYRRTCGQAARHGRAAR